MLPHSDHMFFTYYNSWTRPSAGRKQSGSHGIKASAEMAVFLKTNLSYFSAKFVWNTNFTLVYLKQTGSFFIQVYFISRRKQTVSTARQRSAHRHVCMQKRPPAAFVLVACIKALCKVQRAAVCGNEQMNRRRFIRPSCIVAQAAIILFQLKYHNKYKYYNGRMCFQSKHPMWGLHVISNSWKRKNCVTWATCFLISGNIYSISCIAIKFNKHDWD